MHQIPTKISARHFNEKLTDGAVDRVEVGWEAMLTKSFHTHQNEKAGYHSRHSVWCSYEQTALELDQIVLLC